LFHQLEIDFIDKSLVSLNALSNDITKVMRLF